MWFNHNLLIIIDRFEQRSEISYLMIIVVENCVDPASARKRGAKVWITEAGRNAKRWTPHRNLTNHTSSLVASQVIHQIRQIKEIGSGRSQDMFTPMWSQIEMRSQYVIKEYLMNELSLIPSFREINRCVFSVINSIIFI